MDMHASGESVVDGLAKIQERLAEMPETAVASSPVNLTTTWDGFQVRSVDRPRVERLPDGTWLTTYTLCIEQKQHQG